MKAKLLSLLKLVISISLIGVLFYIRKDTIAQAIATIKDFSPWLLLSGYGIFLMSLFMIAERMRILIQAREMRIKYTETLNLAFVGYFFNNFLPTAIGGDFVKAHYISKITEDKLKSFTAVFMDRFIGLLSLFILAGISLALGHSLIKERALIWFTLIVLALLLLTLIVFLNRKYARIFSPIARSVVFSKISHKIREAYNTINCYRENKKQIAITVLISLAAQILCFSIMVIFAKGLGASIPITMVLLFMPIVSISAMLPSINGLGIRENAIYFLFGPYVGYENAFILSLLWLSMLIFASFIGGVSFLFKKNK